MARELGIRDNLLPHWRRKVHSQGKVTFGGSGTPRDEELAQLKRELARVKKERDFLREAAVGRGLVGASPAEQADGHPGRVDGGLATSGS